VSANVRLQLYIKLIIFLNIAHVMLTMTSPLGHYQQSRTSLLCGAAAGFCGFNGEKILSSVVQLFEHDVCNARIVDSIPRTTHK
jgi:hypothetical protein